MESLKEARKEEEEVSVLLQSAPVLVQEWATFVEAKTSLGDQDSSLWVVSVVFGQTPGKISWL